MMDQVSLKVAKKKTSSDLVILAIEKIKYAIEYRKNEAERMLAEARDIESAWEEQDYDYLVDMKVITEEQADEIISDWEASYRAYSD